MAMHSAEEVRQHVRTYLKVFGALLVLTVVTVGLAYLRMPFGLAVLLAMIVAATKAGLVAGFFMHLIGEKKVIFWVLYLTILFFAVLLLWPVLTDLDQVTTDRVFPGVS